MKKEKYYRLYLIVIIMHGKMVKLNGMRGQYQCVLIDDTKTAEAMLERIEICGEIRSYGKLLNRQELFGVGGKVIESRRFET